MHMEYTLHVRITYQFTISYTIHVVINVVSNVFLFYGTRQLKKAKWDDCNLLILLPYTYT